MKRFAALAIGLIAFVLTGCASGAQEAAAQTPEATEAVVVIGLVVNDTPTPNLTPTIAPVTPVPTATPMETPSAANGTLALTLDQLKQYDGKNGNSAYIAVGGILYDVTNDNNWKNGSHKGYSAGYDLTEQIEGKSPHGTSVLDGVPIVGKLVAG